MESAAGRSREAGMFLHLQGSGARAGVQIRVERLSGVSDRYNLKNGRGMHTPFPNGNDDMPFLKFFFFALELLA
jgi:hypothetical protein